MTGQRHRLIVSIALLLALVGCQKHVPKEPSATAPQSKSAEAKAPIIRNLDGESFDPFDESAAARVFVFVTTDCPIANRYAPKLQRLATELETQDVRFFYVYPNSDDSLDKIRKHRADYSLTAPALLDHEHVLVSKAEATVTPEAAVFDTDSKLVYCGRIDDWYADFGKNRPEPTTHELKDAVEAVLTGQPIAVQRVKAIGCYIPN